MDVVFDLVNATGCIYRRRLFLRAADKGVSILDIHQSLIEWTTLGIMKIENGVVLMLIDDIFGMTT